jgi:hypothetical protein
MDKEPEKYTKVKGLDGETFKLKMEAEYFAHGNLYHFGTGQKFKVKKVYKFNWWRRLLFRLGVSFKSMDLEEVKDGQ